MMLDAHEFTDCRSGRTVAWNDVEIVRANTHQGTFGLDHSLQLDLKASEHPGPTRRRLITTNATSERAITVVFDQLSLRWEDVVTAVEQRSGRPVIRTSDRGFQELRRFTG